MKTTIKILFEYLSKKVFILGLVFLCLFFLSALNAQADSRTAPVINDTFNESLQWLAPLSEESTSQAAAPFDAPCTVTCLNVNPSFGYQGTTMDVTVTGSCTDFQDGLTAVSFMCAGTTSHITVSSTNVTSQTQAVARISIKADAPVGACSVITKTNTEVITCTAAFSIAASDGGGGGGGGATTTTTTPGGVTTTTTSPAVTSTTTSIPPQCAADADCDDGIYCNGAEKCVAGTCTKGQSPCGDEQICKETLKQCWDVTSITGRSLNPNVFRPIIRAQKCLWIIIFTSRDSQFDRDASTIEIAGATAGAQGVSLDTKRNAFKFAGFIFVPVCVEKEATTGTWEITIKTDIEEASTEETIVTSFQVR